MNVQLMGTLRKFLRQQLGNSPAPLRLTAFESAAIAQVEPALLELSRSGRRFVGGNNVIAEGIAPVAAIPTTTADLALYNASQSLSLVIERLGFWLGSGTAAAGATLFGAVSTGRIATAPTAHATGHSAQNAAASSRASKALWSKNVTLPAGSAWFQLQSTFQAAAANAGQGESPLKLDGAIVIPPLHALGLAILSGAGTTPLYGVSAMWSELELDLE